MVKILVLGAGFAGCSAAFLLSKRYDVTVLECCGFPGGGCRTYFYGGHPYTLGPRIFFTKDDEVIKFLTDFLDIRQFYNKTWSYVAEDKDFYFYPIYKSDILRMPDHESILSQLDERKGRTPRVSDFETYWLDAIGPNLYSKFVNNYSKKMWGIESNKNLTVNFDWVNKGNPIREDDIRLYGDMFQGYPVNWDGYNSFFDKSLKDCKVVFDCKVEFYDVEEKTLRTKRGDFKADIVINTISVDSLFNHTYGPLKYSGRKFLKIVLPSKQVLPDDIVWIHYAGDEPFTRITEFKKITNHQSKDTLLGLELPTFDGQHYPVRSVVEEYRFKKYQGIFPQNFYSIGRLGSFSYKGIPDVIRDAIDLAKKII